MKDGNTSIVRFHGSFNNFDVDINILNVTWHSSCPRASKTNQRRSQECE